MKIKVLPFLSSLKLTIALLIIIAALSLLGTVIPQQYGSDGTLRHINPGVAKAFESLQLLDVYHSVWFILLMCLLSLNLITCSLNRFPTSWKLFRKTPSLDPDKPFKNLRPENIIIVEGNSRELIAKIENLFPKRYKRVRKKDAASSTLFYGEKGAYSRFGVYITHASILVVIAGTIVGSLLGFEAFVNLAEGESTNTVYLARQKETKKLDFTVRCDTFSISYYDNGMPKEYRSNLSFLKGNEVVYQGALLVNHPISINGIRFYQASYGTIPGDEVYLTIRKGKDEQTTKRIKIKDPFYLKDNDIKLQVVKIEENFMSMGPAVLIDIKSPAGGARFWVFKYIDKMKERFPGLLQKFPKFNPGNFKPYYFMLDKIESRYYTGLQLSRDPGTYFVAIGAFFIIIGFFITFFSSHKRVWVRIDEQEGKSRISIEATSTRDPVGLKRETDRLMKLLRQSL
jgi:cytochrome c biogenesis protein